MDRVQTFYSLLRIPQRVSAEGGELLAELREKYPYFQGVQLLSAVNAEELFADEAEQKRAEAALQLPDPFALFRYFDAIRLYERWKQKAPVVQPATPIPQEKSDGQEEVRAQEEARLQPQERSEEEGREQRAAVYPTTDLEPEIDLSGVLPLSLETAYPLPTATIYTLDGDEPFDIEEVYNFARTTLNPNYTPPEPVAEDENAAPPKEWQPVTPEQQMELINSFLKNLDGENGIKATVLRKAEEAAQEGVQPEDLGQASEHVANSSSMERVAQIYEQQGEFVKAIEVYEQLVHDFPKKSAYFATEIERLRALVSPPSNS